MAEAAIASAGGDSSAEATWADARIRLCGLGTRTHRKGEPDSFCAERMLSPDAQTRLFTEFEGVDKNKMGEGESERLLPIAERLTTWLRACLQAQRPA